MEPFFLRLLRALYLLNLFFYLSYSEVDFGGGGAIQFFEFLSIYVKSCNHHYIIRLQNSSVAPEISLVLSVVAPFPHPQPLPAGTSLDE